MAVLPVFLIILRLFRPHGFLSCKVYLSVPFDWPPRHDLKGKSSFEDYLGGVTFVEIIEINGGVP